MLEDSGQPMIVSACLVGMHCVCYPPIVLEDEETIALVRNGRAIPICPEQAGGLPTPRAAAGIVGGTGDDLWKSPDVHYVRTTEGRDVTEAFMSGAQEVLRLARLAGSRKVLLRDGSPSCGVEFTNAYDENGTLRRISGRGVVAPLLESAGIEVLSYEARDRQPDHT